MKEQELILLGLLKERPRHGYEIKKKIKEILFLVAGVDLKSIYYPLRILERKGLVKRSASRLGKRPIRFVYHLTSQGEIHFQKLLKASLLSFKRPQFSLDLSLYFLNYIKPPIAQRRLRARLSILKKLSGELKSTINSAKRKSDSASLASILEHNLQMVDAESCFLERLTKTI